jgi:hypothetical protein
MNRANRNSKISNGMPKKGMPKNSSSPTVRASGCGVKRVCVEMRCVCVDKNYYRAMVGEFGSIFCGLVQRK